MEFNRIEEKWQRRWEESELYKYVPDAKKEKFYMMEMFSYPSGANLHVGHWYNYGLADSFARFKRMQGFNVFHPMGFDAFGLPAENYAIKTGIHPMDSTISNIETMERQLRRMGATFDWSAEVKTCMPDYYRWTQWCFLQLYKNGLAYRKEMPVNWCPSCNTTLANEQVLSDGCCERCGASVTRRNLTQWCFRITEYAEELLSGLDQLDWPEKTKLMQKNWIGKSIGGEVVFSTESGKPFTVFTTRPDTLFGVTYMVFSPEHELVDELTTPGQKDEIEAYKAFAAKASEIDRMSSTREKTGAFTGSYAINPINGERIPIYIADYVLATYGTGIIMAVPGHDERDYEFAVKFKLPVRRVINPEDGSKRELPFADYGVMVNSGRFDGMTSEEGKDAVLAELKERNLGCAKVNYRLRDWIISRQRYWGCPIPMVHCEDCGVVPVPESELPVELPYDVDFTPDGTSPLLKSEAFMNTVCPVCGKPAKRDADTMDTFMCSSWYQFRYCDAHNDQEAWNREKVDGLCPVDAYVGGAEHACMHLIYARFFTKAFRDMGYLDFDEPFLRLVHQGTILGPDGNKMSKSRGNVISPDAYIQKYGSDVFRMYLQFGFSYIEGGKWSDDGIKSVARFLDRVERLAERTVAVRNQKAERGFAERELDFVRANAIKAVGADLERFQFNTCIARMMEYVNAVYKYVDGGSVSGEYLFGIVRDLMLLLAPFAPHFAEELWKQLGLPFSVFNQRWPEYDEKALNRQEVEYGVQVNGKVRARVTLPAELNAKEVESAALADESVQRAIEGKTVKKVIVVRNIVNIVAG